MTDPAERPIITSVDGDRDADESSVRPAWRHCSGYKDPWPLAFLATVHAEG